MKKEEIYKEMLKEFGVNHGDIVDIRDDFFLFPYFGKGRIVGCDIRSYGDNYRSLLIIERIEAISNEHGFSFDMIEDTDYISEEFLKENAIYGYQCLHDIVK